MAKQKFQCKGVVRKTGQRVAVEVSAESKEAAIQIAAQHGVAVEHIALAQDASQPPSAGQKSQPTLNASDPAAPQAKEDMDEEIDNIFDSTDDELDEELDDLDLGGGAPAAQPARPSPQVTKPCPYCGEQVLAVAIKCKHCGSYLADLPQQAAPSSVLEPVTRFRTSRRRASHRRWFIVGGASALVVLIVIIVVISWPKGSAPVVQIQPAAAPPAAPAPKAEPPKHSAAELAFAAKLSAFLNACDEMAKLLESVPKPEKCGEQCKAIKDRWAAVPPAPKEIKWAEDAAAQSKLLAESVDAITAGITVQAEALKLAGQPTDSPEVRTACHTAAESLRSLLATIRGLIPPDCLPK